ncbi:MAG TPA: M20/M25/M40 family metallo-hydrolase [Vicinamibacterales bacterium]|nr:M20/M25/M40 family metallo-hydrolase [Vicinamibacterales bacterium]
MTHTFAARRHVHVAMMLAAVSVPAARAQAPPPPATMAQSVRGHMEFLASDALNGRGTGTRDEWIAATYVAAQLRRCGVDPAGPDGAYVQLVDAPPRALSAPPRIVVGAGNTYTHGREIFVRWVGRPGTSGPLVKYTAGRAIPPQAVVLTTADSEPPPEMLAGAAAILVDEPERERARWPLLPRLRISLALTREWRIAVSRDVYAHLSKLPEGTPVRLEASFETARTWNVLGQLRGAAEGRDQTILLHAHLDHLGNRGTGADSVYNGADDDASGITAVLELACALAAMPRTERSWVFAWFGAEETGGIGSRHFAEQAARLDGLVFSLGFEMLGRPDPEIAPRVVWLTGYDRSTLGPELLRLGANLAPDPHTEQRFFFRSDNIRLAQRGVVAHAVASFGLHADYHQPTDELSQIDVPHLVEAIRSMILPLWTLANSRFEPTWHPGMQPPVR